MVEHDEKALGAAKQQAQLEQEIAHKLRERRISRARAELEAIVRRLEADNEALRAQLDVSLGLQDYTPTPLIIKPKRVKDKHTVVPVALASDWHIEERVRPEAVAWLNEYTPEIAQERAERFFRNYHRLIDTQRAGAHIEEAILWLGGDIITGYIHEELVEENWLSPTEASLLAFDMIVGGIDYLLLRADLDALYIPCNYGNHGRTTQRSRVASGARNSYEWQLYQHLRRHYAKDDRVVFQIADGPMLYTDVGGFVMRWQHGDSFSWRGGIGGLLIPLTTSLMAWDSHRQADGNAMGHWHWYHPLPKVVVNGSLIGASAYSTSRVKAKYEPPQQAFFLIDPAHRQLVGHFPIRVT